MKTLQADPAKEKGLNISNDLLYEVLKRVDGVTLAASSCVNSDFQQIAKDEKIWEEICSNRGPATQKSEVKALIKSAGGFNRFYRECYPLILNRGTENWGRDESELWNNSSEEGEIKTDTATADLPSSLVSIIDIIYKEESVLSRLIDGIPKAKDHPGWFSNCPFRIEECFDQEEDFAIAAGLPKVESLGTEQKEGKIWRSLWENLRLSWIILDKKTGKMVNLSSWRPLSGFRHWPSDDFFIIRFGSVIFTSGQAVQCNILIKFRILKMGFGEEEGLKLRLTELSLQMEDMAGRHLNGRNCLPVFLRALDSEKSKRINEVLDCCNRYFCAQKQIKEKICRREWKMDLLAVLIGIGFFLGLCYSIL